MDTQHYFSYLIRIWQGENAQPGGWHASLEDPSTQRICHKEYKAIAPFKEK